MADRDLIAFMRARIAFRAENAATDEERETMKAYTKIVDEFERVSAYVQESSEPIHRGHKIGLEHTVVALAGIWSWHRDWREGWW